MPEQIRANDMSGVRRLVVGSLFDGYAMHSPGWLVIEGERISDLGSGTPDDVQPDEYLPDVLACPGFVDTHVHGGGGVDFSAGAAAARNVLETHRRSGTTTMVASLISESVATLRSQIEALVPLVGADGLAGIHLEGPWLSKQFAGAHDPSHILSPTPADVDTLLTAGAGTIQMVTVAPELPGGMNLVHRLVADDVVPALGHSACTYEDARRAVDAGVRRATHLFNAMPAAGHREPGPILALLEEPAVDVELIADGIHLHDAVVRRAFMVAAERIILVSDAMSAAGLGDGNYRLGSKVVEVENGAAHLAGTTTIAGSTSTLHDIVRHLTTDVGLELTATLRAATSTPADALQLTHVGRLRPGARADVVLMSAPSNLDLLAVFHGGRLVDVSSGPSDTSDDSGRSESWK